MAAALRRNSIADYLLMLLGNAGSAFPSFVIGLVLILVFAIGLKWLPAGGWNNFQARYMVLPIALLTMISVATVGRVTRAPRGCRCAPSSWRHELKPMLIPVVSVIGPLAIASITAAVVIESVFSLPGIGKLIVNGAGNRDYTLVLGLVVLVTVVSVLLNLLVDLAYAWLDPKIRYR